RQSEPGWLFALIFDRDLLIFVAKWTLACLLGEAVGFGLAHAVGFGLAHATFETFYRYPNEDRFILASTMGVAVGAAVGFAQWVLLRRRLGYTQWWILLTTIGWVMGCFANFLTTSVPHGWSYWTALPYYNVGPIPFVRERFLRPLIFAG